MSRRTGINYLRFPILTQISESYETKISEFASNKIKMKISRDKNFEENGSFTEILLTVTLFNNSVC